MIKVLLPGTVPSSLDSPLLALLQPISPSIPLNSLLFGDLPLNSKKLSMIKIWIHQISVIIEEACTAKVFLCPWVSPQVLTVHIRERIILRQICDLCSNAEALLQCTQLWSTS
jgi:hypothetical protein